MAVVFNNTNTQRFTSTTALVPTTPGTVTYWAHPFTLVANNMRMVGSNTDYESQIRLDDMLHAYMTSGGAAGVRVYDVVLAQPQLHTYTWNGTVKQVYIDGVQKFSGVVFHGAPASTALSLGAATWQLGSNQFYGILDDVRIYNRVLSGDELMEMFLTRNGVIIPGLINRWTLRGGADGAVAVNEADMNGTLNMVPANNPVYNEWLVAGHRRR